MWIRGKAEGERVLIEIEDQCGGLPPGKIEELFQPFTQKSLDKSGVGLGLAIAAAVLLLLTGFSSTLLLLIY